MFAKPAKAITLHQSLALSPVETLEVASGACKLPGKGSSESCQVEEAPGSDGAVGWETAQIHGSL